MARYVDGDALKTDILKKYKQNWEVPCSYEDRIIQRVVTDLRVLIEQNIPADVAPKSEVARGIIEFIKGRIKAAEDHTPSEDLDKAIGIVDWILSGVIDDLEKKYTEGEG